MDEYLRLDETARVRLKDYARQLRQKHEQKASSRLGYLLGKRQE
jgi:hypothetical protein